MVRPPYATEVLPSNTTTAPAVGVAFELVTRTVGSKAWATASAALSKPAPQVVVVQ